VTFVKEKPDIMCNNPQREGGRPTTAIRVILVPMKAYAAFRIYHIEENIPDKIQE
jgi:hypothetical protein